MEVYTPSEWVYNTDQTGIYYQNLPNIVYVGEWNKKYYSSVKQMKDKTCITLIVGTLASGKKLPLDVVGKPKNP